MNSSEVTAIVTAAANLICQCFTPEETAVLAAVFTQLGDTLDTKLAVDKLCE